MKRKITILLISLVINQTSIFSQENRNENTAKGIPQESAYVHFNSSILLAGERLYYAFYCLNTDTKKLSTLSKIGYIELVGDNNKVVFKHKIRLKKGVGHGDFKIAAEVPSGNYKIIGYTQWMRNGKRTNLFYDDVVILNPYSLDQQVFINKDSILSDNDSLLQRGLKTSSSQFLKMNLVKKIYKKREKVSLTLTSNNIQNYKGTYSISVKKIDAIDILQPRQISTTIFKKRSTVENTTQFEDIVFLPELRGEIVSGVLINKDDNLPVLNEKISLSIPQKDFILKISTTNNKGRFYFNINERYSSRNAIVQVLNRKNTAYQIVLDIHKPISTKGIKFSEFKISKKYNKKILKRSIYNQIENSYSILKQDSIKRVENIIPFFGEYDIVYSLDNFTRFSTLKETFVEIIKKASIFSKNNGELGFHVESLNPYVKNKEEVAVIVDGILQQNYSKLLEYNARKIKKISIARTNTKFVIGTKFFEGFIVIETFKGDFNKELTSDLTNVSLFKPQPIKKYFKRTHGNNKRKTISRVPDYRKQLLWQPMIDVRTQNLVVDFFTSDNIGTYEISIEGFTSYGDPISLKEYIVVE